jgi:hypothetical protein
MGTPIKAGIRCETSKKSGLALYTIELMFSGEFACATSNTLLKYP